MRLLVPKSPLLRRAVAVAISVAAFSLALYVFTSRGLDFASVAILAIGGSFLAIAGWNYPLATTLAILCLAQEIRPEQGNSGMTVFASDAYFSGIAQVPWVVCVAGTTWLIAWLRSSRDSQPEERQASPRWAQVAVWALLLAGVLATLQALLSGSDLLPVLRRTTLPFLSFGLTVDLARRRWRLEARACTYVLLGSLAVLAVTGIAQAGLGGGAFVYYDTATSYVCAIALLGVFSIKRVNPQLVLIAACALLVLLLGSRRSVMIGLVVAIVLVIMIRMRGRVGTAGGMRRLATVALIVVVALGPLSSFAGSRIAETWGTIVGTAEDASTLGHLADISVGWQAFTARPFGYGWDHPQLSGLVAAGTGGIYVHNEFLEIALRYGIVIAAVFTAGVGALVVGLRYLRRPELMVGEGSFIVAGSLASGQMLIFCLMTAPFFTTTVRWPLLLGLLLGAAMSAVAGIEPQVAEAVPGTSGLHGKRSRVATGTSVRLRVESPMANRRGRHGRGGIYVHNECAASPPPSISQRSATASGSLSDSSAQ